MKVRHADHNDQHRQSLCANWSDQLVDEPVILVLQTDDKNLKPRAREDPNEIVELGLPAIGKPLRTVETQKE